MQIDREMSDTEPSRIRINAGCFKLSQLPQPLAY